MALQSAFLLAILALAALPNVRGESLSDDEKVEILNAHNYYRGKVSPIAIDMQRLVWNDELSYLAQFWAGGCEFELNENRNSQSGAYPYVGQIMAATVSYSVNYTVLMGTWFQEAIYYDVTTNYCTDGDGDQAEYIDESVCERYVQLVWAKTEAVGCGVFRCEELMGAENANENALFMVCYYGPGRTAYTTERPYQTGGEACTSCPTDKPYCVGNLCSAESGAPVVAQVSLLCLLLAVVGAMSSLL